MRRRVLSISAIIALGMSMSLSADMIKRYGNDGDKLVVLPYVGVTNFKNLDKKQGFLEVKIIKMDTPLFLTDIKISSAYKDISLSNLIFVKYSTFNMGFLSAGIGTGYMQHDAMKQKFQSSSIETQKAPYVKFSVNSAYMLSKGILLNASLDYKVPLDRADMESGYGAEAGINFGDWHLSTNYSKFNFSGAEDQEDVSIKLGYSFRF